jgi:CRP-like cAMP-binding protein
MLNDGCSEVRPAQTQARRNRLLSCLQQQASDALTGSSTRVWLSVGAELTSAGAPLTHVYFPESGLISVARDSHGGRATHFGIYGAEGFGSISSVLGAPISPFTEIVQQSGFAQRVNVRDLHELFHPMPEIDRLFVRYAHIFMLQIADGLASAGCRVEQRLARWLLMLQDRAMSGHLAFTHQRLANLLGVRRAGVTDAIHLLEGRRLISAQRGMIKILDRPRLQTLTAGCYGRPEREYQRVILSGTAA